MKKTLEEFQSVLLAKSLGIYLNPTTIHSDNSPFDAPKLHKEKNLWHFISSIKEGQALEALFTVFEKLKFEKSKEIKFLDAGCGTGMIMSIADAYFERNVSYGIEIYKKYIDRAVTLNSKFKDRIFHMDIRDFKKYGDYDIIYSYMPLVNIDDDLFPFYRNIAKQLKSGSYIILPNGAFPRKLEGMKIVPESAAEKKIIFRGYYKVYKKI